MGGRRDLNLEGRPRPPLPAAAREARRQLAEDSAWTMRKLSQRGAPWTPEQDALLLNPPPDLMSLKHPGRVNTRAMAAHLGRTSGAVTERLRELRLDRRRGGMV